MPQYLAGMKPIDELILEAEQKRDYLIEQAKRECLATIREIRALEKRLRQIAWTGKYGPRQVKPVRPGTPIYCMNLVQAAIAVLSEQPMTMVELVLAIQDRGCKADVAPQRVLRSLQENFRYHKDTFTQDAEGRWGIID